MAAPSQPRRIRRRHIGGFLVAIAGLFLGIQSALIANSGAENPSVEEYYSSFESRLGYWLFLGNRRHCAYYPKNTLWPFPISKASAAMEEKLYSRLGVKEGLVLDAGAGGGYVAMTMARHGLKVSAIDITPIHVEEAKRNVKRFGLEDKVTVHHGDYHNLTEPDFIPGTFDGIYTMETFVHADDPIKVLKNFYRLLKPGGVLVNHEADLAYDSPQIQEILRLSHCRNTFARGVLEKNLQDVGFRQIDVEDLTENVLPIWRLIKAVGYVPYMFLKALGLQNRFTNLLAGVELWGMKDQVRYISVRAVKP